MAGTGTGHVYVPEPGIESSITVEYRHKMHKVRIKRELCVLVVVWNSTEDRCGQSSAYSLPLPIFLAYVATYDSTVIVLDSTPELAR